MRHTRQIRLSEVGEAGQAKLAATERPVEGSGLAAEVTSRYLAAAGVGALVVPDAYCEAAARAIEPQVRTRVEAGAATPSPLPFDMQHPAARAVAAGAYRALLAIREALA